MNISKQNITKELRKKSNPIRKQPPIVKNSKDRRKVQSIDLVTYTKQSQPNVKKEKRKSAAYLA